MMQTVQLAISDGAFSAAVREALSRSCAWHVEAVDRPDPSRNCVLVLDERAFERLSLPLTNPERVVLITRKDTHEMMAQAWEAGVVSAVSGGDSLTHPPPPHHPTQATRCKIPQCRRSEGSFPQFRIRHCANIPTPPDFRI